jgi:hypothetical protein
MLAPFLDSSPSFKRSLEVLTALVVCLGPGNNEKEEDDFELEHHPSSYCLENEKPTISLVMPRH